MSGCLVFEELLGRGNSTLSSVSLVSYKVIFKHPEAGATVASALSFLQTMDAVLAESNPKHFTQVSLQSVLLEQLSDHPFLPVGENLLPSDR